jgi:conjugal transfer ATP-binding protein TraC
MLGRLIEKVEDYCGFESGKMKETSRKRLNEHLEHNFLGAVPLRDYLHYKSYVEGIGIFFNDDGIAGFLTEISMKVGSSESLEKNLNLFFNNEIPEGIYMQFLVVGSNNIENKLSLWREGRHAHNDSMLDRITRYREAFLREHARDIGSSDGRVGRDWRTFVSCSMKNVDENNNKLELLVKFKEKLLKKFVSIKLSPRSCDVADLKYLTNDLINMQLTPLSSQESISTKSLDSSSHTQRNSNKHNLLERLSDQILEGINEASITEEEIKHLKTDLVTRGYYVKKLPESFAINNMVSLLGTDLEGGFPARLVISYSIANNINKADEGKIIAEGLRSIHASEKWYTRHDLSLQHEARWWRVLIDRNKNGEKFLTENFQVFITTKQSAMEIAEEKLLSHYNSLDFQLARNDKLHLVGLLSILPMQQAAFWKTLKFFQLVKNVPASEVVAKLPIHGEWKGISKSGILLLGRKGEMFNWHPFYRVGGAGNYNVCVMAPSGSGKSFFLQELATSLVSQNVQVFVLDIGASYQNIAEAMDNSEFLRFNALNDLSLNPFHGIIGSGAVYLEAQKLKREGRSREAIMQRTGLTPEGLEILFSENPEERDMAENETIEVLKIGEHFVTKDAIIYAKTTISTMCGVSGDNTKEAIIEKGLNEGIKQYGEGLNLDRYAKVLEEMDNGIGRDLAISLYPYTSNGVHGRYFKQGKNAKFNSPLTVFEFEEVKGDEVFLSVILGIILMQITMQFLCGDRSRKFVLIVDEAWRIIDHSVGFLEAFARTVRKYGGSLITCVQEFKDLDNGPKHQAILNNSSWTAVLRQEPSGIGQMRNSEKFKHCVPLIETLTKDAENKYSEIMIMGSNLRVVGRLVVDPYSECLYSTENEDYGFLHKCRSSGLDKDTAIRELIKRKGKKLPVFKVGNESTERKSGREEIILT